MSYLIASVADVAEHLGVRAGNKQFDKRLTSLLQTAALSIETETGRFLEKAARVQLFDTADAVETRLDLWGSSETGIHTASRPQRFILNTLNLDPGSGFTVWYDPSRQFSDPGRILDPSSYVVDWRTGVLKLQAPTRRAMAALRVDHTGGWAVDPSTLVMSQPDPRLATACMAQVAYLWAKLDPDNVGMDSDRTKGASSSSRSLTSKFLTPAGLTPEAASMVAWMKPILTGRG